MADRKSIFSRPILATAIIAASVYLGVIGVGRYYRYCEDRSLVPHADAFKRAVAVAVSPDDEAYTNYSRIEPGLYVGGSILKPPPDVTAVLNLCEIEDPYKVEVHRSTMIPDADPAPDLDWLKGAVDFISEQRKSGRIVYVHCAMGISRANFVTSAYLMADRGWTRDEALEYIRKQRPQAGPRPAFMDRLLEWEKKIAK
jgi:Dual specificity phosphatase, catalytic domain